ncbi:MAG: SDR family oxidoreductase [Pseudomonadota bacterium]
MLVTGANGFVGQALCAEAVRRGLQVRGATRSDCRLPAGAEAAIVGAVDGETDWSSVLDGVDVVIHLAARVHVMHDESADPLHEFQRVNTLGTEHLAHCAAANGVRRLVYVSSVKVNGEQTVGNKFSERDHPMPVDPYGVSKWQAEQALHRVAAETGLQVVILRPPLVYGPGVKGNFIQMLSVVAKRVPLPFASINNRRDLIYLGNLVDALIVSAEHAAAAGQTYLVCDGVEISTPALLRQLAAGLGVPSRLLPCPAWLLQFAGKCTGKSEQVERLLGSLQVDSGKIRRDLNWVPPHTLRLGLQSTAEWYRNTYL